MVESSGQLGGKDDVRQVQGPRLDTSSPDHSSGVESTGSAVPGSGASPGESAASTEPWWVFAIVLILFLPVWAWFVIAGGWPDWENE